MRNLKTTYDALVPKHEKEWDAKLLIDSALKNDVEHKLQIMAHALSGKYKISFEKSPHKDKLHKNEVHTSGDCGSFVKTTTKHKLLAKLQSEDSGYVFYGNNNTQIYLQIIDFWAGKCSVFPCGGAQFQVVERE